LGNGDDQPAIRETLGEVTSRFALIRGCHFEISLFVSSYAACRSNLACMGLASGTDNFFPIDLDLLFCCMASDFLNDWRLGSVRDERMSVMDSSDDSGGVRIHII
jgi:hypothetical protein